MYGAFKDFFDDIVSGTSTYSYVNPRDTEAMNMVIKGEKDFGQLGYYTALVDCSVEHIYAQNCELGPIDEWHTHCLGNCTLLGQKLNSAVGKLAPVKKFKLPAYLQSGFQPTIDLTVLQKWDISDIEQRHKDFSERWYAVFEKS